MLISIIIPCYNAERTIADTIRSALAQEVEREVIVIDDGSTDGSATIISCFEPQIRVERGANAGVSAARNRGGELARGNLLQYLDSDDQLAPGTLFRRRNALVSTHSDAAYTNWQKLVESEDGSCELGEVVVPPWDELEKDAEAACADSRFWAPPAAILYRRELIERIGFWRPNLPVIQDARFLFDAAAQGARFVHVPEVGAIYRVRSKSLSRGNHASFMRDCFVNAREIEAYWRDRKDLTPRRIEVLRTMYRNAAIAALANGWPEFESARQFHNAIARRDFTIESGWALRRTVGAKAASALARAELKRRVVLRRESPAGS
jgi:glycosyltransferase involved in cell wall biosynthesis